MIKNCVFHLEDSSDFEKIIQTFGLKKVLSNKRTSIYQNAYMRFSFDKLVIRVLIYNLNSNDNILEKLYNYFYGKEYENI